MKNILHELKLRNPYVKIHPVNQSTKDLFSGFIDTAIKINGRITVPILSKGWYFESCFFFLTENQEKIILRKDNLKKIEKEVAQKTIPITSLRD